jgi:hypothetical protein
MEVTACQKRQEKIKIMPLSLTTNGILSGQPWNVLGFVLRLEGNYSSCFYMARRAWVVAILSRHFASSRMTSLLVRLITADTSQAAQPQVVGDRYRSGSGQRTQASLDRNCRPELSAPPLASESNHICKQQVWDGDAQPSRFSHACHRPQSSMAQNGLPVLVGAKTTITQAEKSRTRNSTTNPLSDTE